MAEVKQKGIISKTAKQEVAKKNNQTIKDYIKLYKGEIAKALPDVMTPERFARIVTTAVTNNPKLAECTPQSFVGAMLNSAQLGLEPNTALGQAYLIPYGRQCQFQIGYRGLIDLAFNFNPRTPYGMRLQENLKVTNTTQFQSTHPLRDATW